VFRLLAFGCALVCAVLGALAAVPPGGWERAAALAPQKAVIVDVRHFGAKGDGVHDDSRPVQRAIAAAAARPGSIVHFPVGTYVCKTPVRLADGIRVGGQGKASWIKGQMVFASHDRVERLKIGVPGRCAVTNAGNARGTSFFDCRFHGGGSRQGTDSSVVYLGGAQGSVSDVLFARCQIERTSYVPPAGLDTYAKNVGNTITIHEFCSLPKSGHVEHITFRDCRLGAFNGRARGALRMMMEAFTWDNGTDLVYHGWSDLTFDGCTIEASDTTGLDFADRLVPATGAHSSHGVLVTGCTFLGAAKDNPFGYTGLPIVYECPTGIVIKDNTFWASPHEAIGGSWVRESTDAPALLIQGNTFDMTRSPIRRRHEAGEPCISLVGYHSRVIDNTFIYGAGSGVLIKGSGGASLATVGNLVRGNTFTDTRRTSGEPTILLMDARLRGCYDNRITANTIVNRAAGRAGVIAQTSGSGTNLAEGNTIVCGSATPFVVLAGMLVQSNNVVRP